MSAWVVLSGFAIGSIPCGYLLYRWRTGGDLRSEGSGNIGATNVARTLGLKGGMVTLLLDAGKGAGAVALGRALGRAPLDPLLAGASAILGHVFSPWLRLRGGKGVATSLGVFAVLEPLASGAAVIVFLVTVLWTRYVSLGSLLGVVVLPLVLLLRARPPQEVLLTAGVAVLIAWRHRQNIARLRAGTEPRFAIGTRASAP